MRIAYIYDAVYPFVKGGVEKRLYEIGSRLAKRHEIHWFSLDWGGNIEGVEVHPVGVWRSLYHRRRRSVSEAMYFALKLLTKFEGEYDVIDCQQFPYLSCFSMKLHSHLQSIPMVITWHEFWGKYWFEYLGSVGVFGRRIERTMMSLSQVNVSVSRLTQRALARRGVQSTLIPNGISSSVIQRVPPFVDDFDIIFVGRLVPEKNVLLLLNAVKIVKGWIPDIKVVIIGDGPERERLERHVKRLDLGDNIVFTGFLNSYDQVISYMKSSRVLVLPSKREGFGIVALEANAAGVPVVTVDYPMNATKELVVPGYNGFVAVPSKESLAESIFLAIEKGKKMRGNCIKNAKKYDWDRIARMTEKVYEGVLNER